MIGSTTERQVHDSDVRSSLVHRAFCVGEWVADPSTNRISRADDAVKLEPRVMDVLVYLAERQGQVVSRDEIEAAVWAGLVVGYDTVTGAVQNRRRS